MIQNNSNLKKNKVEMKNIEENSIGAFIRAMVFVSLGDNNLDEGELNRLHASGVNLVGWHEQNAAMHNLLGGFMSALFGSSDDEDEVEEDTDGSWDELTEEEVDEIVTSVHSALAKCENASDIQAYADICAGSISKERYQSSLINLCFQIASSFSSGYKISDQLEKGEIRNIKYLCKAFKINYKEAEQNYTDNLTPWDDDYAREHGITVHPEEIDDTYKDSIEFKILCIATMAADSDFDFSCSGSNLTKAMLMIHADVSQTNGSKEIHFPKNWEDVIGLWQPILGAELETGKYDYLTDIVNMDDDDWEDYELDHTKLENHLAKYNKAQIKNIIKIIDSIDDYEKHQKTIYKAAHLFAQADSDQNLGYTKIHKISLFSEDGMEEEVLDINFREMAALEAIKEKLNFDEDVFYGFNQRLNDGELGYI